MGNEIISINGLESGYDELQVLFGVNLEVNPGEIVVLIGPNGAGKSTVLKSVFNLATNYKGSTRYQNTDITGIKTHELIKRGISYVPQGRQVFPSLTVKENLEMGAYLIDDKKLVEKRIQEVLNHFPDLKSRLSNYAFELSGGQQQMLAIGRALMQDPKLLLLDEPSLGLSPKLMKELFLKIKYINKEGTAILIVEQNAKAACEMADRIYVLENGKIALHGGKELLKNPKIRHIYLGGH